jgi:hypothetical protein
MMAALFIATDSLEELLLSNFGLGCMLVIGNLVIFVLSAKWCFDRWRREHRLRAWLKAIPEDAFEMLMDVMVAGAGRAAHHNHHHRNRNSHQYQHQHQHQHNQQGGKSGKGGRSATIQGGRDTPLTPPPPPNENMVKIEAPRPSVMRQKSFHDDLLKKYLIDSRSIEIKEKIGSGSFGTVFSGSMPGHHSRVAIKTLNDVTAKNAKLFRSEIILTATLRHPNIVEFIGACCKATPIPNP